jgi:hypothetical protein
LAREQAQPSIINLAMIGSREIGLSNMTLEAERGGLRVVDFALRELEVLRGAVQRLVTSGLLDVLVRESGLRHGLADCVAERVRCARGLISRHDAV